MTEIENTNSLTLAQLIEIWEFCNGAEDCQKCPLKDTSCAKILHTATLEALKNLVQLVDLQKEENEQLKKDKEKLACSFANAVGQKMTAKTEAIKEFADRLKEDISGHRLEMYMNGLKGTPRTHEITYESVEEYIDNLVKEMVGDAE